MSEAITKAEYRWIQLNGYGSSPREDKRYGLRKGWWCLNCYSMVYLDKCPNDQCYNFYGYINRKRCKSMEDMLWNRLAELGIT